MLGRASRRVGFGFGVRAPEGRLWLLLWLLRRLGVDVPVLALLLCLYELCPPRLGLVAGRVLFVSDGRSCGAKSIVPLDAFR